MVKIKHLKHMVKLMGKKIITMLRSKNFAYLNQLFPVTILTAVVGGIPMPICIGIIPELKKKKQKFTKII